MTIYLFSGEVIEYAYNIVFNLHSVEIMFDNKASRIVHINEIERIKR